jgi:protein-tyrosine kinase
MGKFDDALRKALRAKNQAAGKTASNKVVEIRSENIDVLRLDKNIQKQEPEVAPPNLRDKIDARLITLLEPHSPAGEYFRLLRTKLFCKDALRGPRTIMITSPQAFDGKSTVTANLAITIAQGTDTHVLLVDCDLRQPALHRLMGVSQDSGLREYLEDGTSVAPFLKKTFVDKLTLLQAGQSLPNPSELLGSNRMKQFVKEIKDRYPDRYVIFDTAPAALASEIGFLSTLMDGVLLVIRLGKTSRKITMQAIEHISRDKILGIIFNADNEPLQNYKYYSQYYQRGNA